MLVWGLAATAYVLGHDTLLAAAMRHERDMQYGYEDKIADLRRNLERITTERAQLERTVGTRLDMLTAQEGELRRRASAVAALADGVSRLAPTSAVARQTLPSLMLPEADPTTTPERESRRDALPSERTADRLATLTRALGALEQGQQDALGHLQEQDRQTERQFSTENLDWYLRTFFISGETNKTAKRGRTTTLKEC